MKPLSEMTREELWNVNFIEAKELSIANKVEWHGILSEALLRRLDERRLRLQQESNS